MTTLISYCSLEAKELLLLLLTGLLNCLLMLHLVSNIKHALIVFSVVLLKRASCKWHHRIYFLSLNCVLFVLLSTFFNFWSNNFSPGSSSQAEISHALRWRLPYKLCSLSSPRGGTFLSAKYLFCVLSQSEWTLEVSYANPGEERGGLNLICN